MPAASSGERVRLCHVVGGGEFGGAERHIVDLLGSLTDRYEPQVVCFYEGVFSKALRERGIPVSVIAGSRYDPSLASRLERHFRREGIDLVHTHGVRANFFGRLAASRLRGVPLVTTVHSLLRLDYPHLSGRLPAMWMERWSRRRSDRFIAVSSAVAQALQDEGVPSGRVRVVHGGVDVERLDREAGVRPKGWLREELGLDAGTSMVGMVARFHPVKGHAVFFRAAEIIARRRSDVRFVLVGTGNDRDRIMARLRASEAFPRFIDLGFRTDVGSLLREFDLHVTPSLYEGLGLSVLEAMALGVPVVVSRAGGLVDVVKDGRTGLSFPPGDAEALAAAALRLIEDPGLAQRLAAAGREQVLHAFTVQHMAAGYEAVYGELC